MKTILSKKILAKNAMEKTHKESFEKPPTNPPKLHENHIKTPPKILQKSPQNSSNNPLKSHMKKSQIQKIWQKKTDLFFHARLQ